MHIGADRIMKVGIVYRLDHPGGMQSCALSLVKGLNRRGIIPDILWDVEPDWSFFKRSGIEARYRHLKFPVSSLVMDRLPSTLRFLAGLANILSGDRYGTDYGFLYIFYNGFLVTNGTPHLRYVAGPPLLPQLEIIRPGVAGIPFRTSLWLYQNFLRKVSPAYELHPGNNYVTISQFIANLFQEAYKVDLPVISPSIEMAERHFDFTDLKDRDTLTFFSRFADYKRPELVLDLAEQHLDMRCVMMGGVPPHRRPYFEALQKQAKDRELDKVVFLARPSDLQIKEELARTRFYVFPAINEHFGMTTAEAIASGAIPYVHDSGGQKEIVNDPRLRFEDLEFFDKFDALMNCPEMELNQIRKALSIHIQQYSEDVFIEKMLSYIDC